MEFSKQIIFFTALGYAFIMAFSFLLMFKTGDLSPLNLIIPAAAAEVATATGFYYNKAKEENKIKLERIYRNKNGS